MTETITINLGIVFVVALVLIVLLLWIRKKDFRYSKSIKILLCILLICNGIFIFAGISAIFSDKAASIMILVLLWIMAVIYNR